VERASARIHAMLSDRWGFVLSREFAQNFVPVRVPSLKRHLHAPQQPLGIGSVAAVLAHSVDEQCLSDDALLARPNVAINPCKGFP
jgi:hypothetical protein